MPAGASDSDVLGALVERSSAATKVQAGFRGHRDRKKIAETKRAEAGEESAPEQGQDGVDGTAESA